jgi:hypothetical protein
MTKTVTALLAAAILATATCALLTTRTHAALAVRLAPLTGPPMRRRAMRITPTENHCQEPTAQRLRISTQ